MWNNKKIDQYNKIIEIHDEGGGEHKIFLQHQKGKLTAKERIAYLTDNGTFTQTGMLVKGRNSAFDLQEKYRTGDGVITGLGKINGQTVCIAAEDFTIMGGTLGEYHSKKICEILQKAIDLKVPMIFLNDSGGARIEEGVDSLNGYSNLFRLNTLASGMIPQISAIMGPCAGGACYSPAICDFIFMTKETSFMYITGPKVVKEITGEDIDGKTLGGAQVHSSISGVAHFICQDDFDCLNNIKKLLSYINFDQLNTSKCDKTCSSITNFVPDNLRKPYDIHNVINEISDNDTFFEVQSEFAKNVVIGFSRIDGRAIGIIANQPLILGGAIDCDASDKMARFIRFCDSNLLPLVVFVDVPAFLPGRQQEHNGIIRHGAKILFAFSEASVPKITIILRKAYGGAYIAMNSKGLGADYVVAWPLAEIAVMGVNGAIEVLLQDKIKNGLIKKTELEKFEADYEKEYLNPFISAYRGFVDEVIRPEETRQKVIMILELLKDKNSQKMNNKKHSNIPL